MSPQIDLATHIELPVAQLPQADPCVLVIFGATGDLTRRKLIPALYHLACEGCMAGQFQVVGIGLDAMGDDAFRGHLKEGVAQSVEISHFDEDEWRAFAPRETFSIRRPTGVWPDTWTASLPRTACITWPRRRPPLPPSSGISPRPA